MNDQSPPAMDRLRRKLRQALTGPHILAFLPAVVLGSFWIGGEAWLLAVSLGLPVLYAFAGGFSQWQPDGENRPPLPPLDQILDTRLEESVQKGIGFGCFLIALDDFEELRERHGVSAARRVVARVTDRIGSALRQGDLVLTPDDGVFAVILAPVRHLDLEAAIQLSRRMQYAVEEPISMDATSVFISCSIGFCLSQQSVSTTGLQMLDGATTALSEARANGPSAIRAFTEGMKAANISRTALSDEVSLALESGQIHPWYQPQISTDTGHITGFEALARWIHPSRGVVPPADFLPVLERAGLMERLGEVMLARALDALRDWDQAGAIVPRVGVNFTPEELRNPKLLEKITWELDRYDLSANRLSVEVLETVVAASPDDVVARNINGLSKLGCAIDLDDFGTGHASISSIRRFAIQRIKIDRSFVMKVDRNPDQQRMVTAILTMAERLNLETLAEGVETVGEHAMLAQLGCGHVQGFGIARPMPFEQTLDWIRAHEAKLQNTPCIGRSTG